MENIKYSDFISVKIKYNNSVYVGLEECNKFKLSMNKMRDKLKKAKEINDFIGEQYLNRNFAIIKEINEIQKKYNLKILSYIFRDYSLSFIKTLEGEKYILKNKKELIKCNSWNII